MHMYELMTSDILEVVSYIPYGIGVSFVFVLCMALYQYVHEKRIQLGRLFLLGTMIVYFVVLLQTAFFSREPGSRAGEIDWRILSNWQNDILVRVYALENIIMFLPFGVLGPLMGKVMRRVYFCIPLAMLLSVVIEAAQFITERGFCQLEDLIMNTIGAVIGYCIWAVIQYSSRWKRG